MNQPNSYPNISQQDWKLELDALLQYKRREMLRLIEVSDLTDQLAQAVDRKDQVAVKLMLSMRQQPITQLMELETAIEERLPSLPQETAIRLHELLKGEPAASPLEEPLCRQIAQNRRLLEKIVERDRRISLQINSKRSFYTKFRP